MNLKDVWRYARNVGYDRSPSGWWHACRDLYTAMPWIRTLTRFGVPDLRSEAIVSQTTSVASSERSVRRAA